MGDDGSRAQTQAGAAMRPACSLLLSNNTEPTSGPIVEVFDRAETEEVALFEKQSL